MTFARKINAITLDGSCSGMDIYLDGQAHVQVSFLWMQANKPAVGDYLVHSDDGYYHTVKESIVKAIYDEIQRRQETD